MKEPIELGKLDFEVEIGKIELDSKDNTPIGKFPCTFNFGQLDQNEMAILIALNRQIVNITIEKKFIQMDLPMTQDSSMKAHFGNQKQISS